MAINRCARAGLPGRSLGVIKRGARLQHMMAGLQRQNRTLKASVGRLTELATHDELTGQYNRRFFNGEIGRQLARASRFKHPLSLLMIDLDHFKQVNDEYGHRAGDAVLARVAEEVAASIRGIDVLCRYGGEEFALLLPETPEDGALVVAKRLLQRVADMAIEVPLGSEASISIKITISIGSAAFPAHAQSEAGLIAEADQALYAAKRAGRNQVQQVA